MELAVNFLVKLCACATVYGAGRYIDETQKLEDSFTTGWMTGILSLASCFLVDAIL